MKVAAVIFGTLIVGWYAWALVGIIVDWWRGKPPEEVPERDQQAHTPP